MKVALILLLSVSCLVVFTHSFNGMKPNPLGEFIKTQRSKEQSLDHFIASKAAEDLPVQVQPQDGLKKADKIDLLPGQPDGINFSQYSGYVTVDAKAGRALFYYFTESQEDSSTKPLVLWLNGGPGCSSLGYGAMMELGPFRVNSDGKTLHHNEYSWNNVANILFLESPAGVGFSYSNTSSDYDTSGDKQTAHDAYVFLVNWLERFPEYKARDFFIAGESYAGHYVPQLAQKILHNNIITNQTVINLQGIAIGNAWIDNETGEKGTYDFYWTHALISDETNRGINLNCNFSSDATFSDACEVYLDEARRSHGNIYAYDIYAPLCFSSSTKSGPSISEFDPCSEDYIYSYLNTPLVQQSLHVTALPFPWEACNETLNADWNDQPLTVLPVIQELMSNGISVWIYSGDTDPSVPVTSTRYSIEKLGTAVKTSWYPWYTEGEVGGYAVGYDQNLTFMTIRGAGHFTPSYQPARALAMFTSFLDNKLSPRNES